MVSPLLKYISGIGCKHFIHNKLGLMFHTKVESKDPDWLESAEKAQV
jgi:hypothetical protein